MDRDVAVAVPNTEGGRQPVFSPDGEWIAFHHVPTGKLKKTRVAGGGTMNLADWLRGYGGDADWDVDDTIVFGGREGIYRVSASGGERQPIDVTLPDGEAAFAYPRHPDMLPSGDALLATSGSFRVGENVALYLLDRGERRILIPNARYGRYLPPGHIVFVRDDTLYAVAFDASRLVLRGEPVPILENLHASITNGSTQFSFSETGSLAYVPAAWNDYRRRLVWVDRQGNVEPIRSLPGRVTGAKISPGGDAIVLTIFQGTRPGLWLTEPSRETLVPFLPGSWAYAARWSPDGKRLAFIGSSEGKMMLRFHRSALDEVPDVPRWQ